MKMCLLCLQDINKHQDFFHWLRQDMYLCGDCLQQLLVVNKEVKVKNMSIHAFYSYNEFLENMLFQYKEGRDIALAPVFFHECKQQLQNQYKGYTLCLCPSSEEKTKERGFHALARMLDMISLPKQQPFYKSKNYKQSKQHKKEREEIENIIHLKDKTNLQDKKICLIDDVCTTGSTLNACYHLLTPYTKDIKILVLCIHPILLE